MSLCGIVSKRMHMQSILNTAVRLVAGSSRRDHVTSLLRDRHCHLAARRIQVVHDCLSSYGDAPSYSVDFITPSAAASARAGLRYAESMTVAVPRTLSSFGDSVLRLPARVRETS